MWQLWDTVEGPAHTLSSGRPVRPGLIAQYDGVRRSKAASVWSRERRCPGNATRLHTPTPQPLQKSNRPERSRDCPRPVSDMAATTPCGPLGLPSQAGVVFSVDYCSHFRKDSRLYSYRRAGQSPKPYNLLPHPKGRPSVLVSSWMLRLLEMPPRGRRAGNMVRGPTWPARC